MPHDQVVTPRHLLEAQMLLERAGHGRFLRDLESREPEMANYLMENCSQLHGQLMALGGPARRTQRLYLQMEALLLVCLRAQRDAHRELWDDQDPPGPAPPRVTPFDPFPPATLLLAGPVDHYLPGYVLAATSGCPLCGVRTWWPPRPIWPTPPVASAGSAAWTAARAGS